MVKITIEVPEEVAEQLKELEAKRAELKSGTGPVDWMPLAASAEAVGSGLVADIKRRLLRDVDIDAKRILVDGKPHVKVGRHQATYYAKEAALTMTRSVYRPCGERNAKTVDVVSLRLGVVGGWLPEAAKAAAFLVQQGTSREAAATARALGVLPFSRSSFERVGHKVGAHYSVVRDDVEDALIRGYEVPAEARSVSVSVDRVAVPFEEPRPRGVGRPRRGAAKRPVDRVWHMAYVGTVTLHDVQGDAIHTLRYARMPSDGADDLVSNMATDVQVLLGKRDLSVMLLSDGAPELIDVLDRHVDRDAIGREPRRLIDFWHVVEKLGAAARVIHGEKGAGPVIDRWRALLLNSATAVPRILGELERSGYRHVRVGDERPVHAAITYLTNNQFRMDFASARAAGLPIGSGNVEATCKSLIGQRLVRTGSRWKEETAQHVADLRALALSERFDDAVDLTLRPLRHQVQRAA